MKTTISAIIEKLEELKKAHGDVHVRVGREHKPILRIEPRRVRRYTATGFDEGTELEVVW